MIFAQASRRFPWYSFYSLLSLLFFTPLAANGQATGSVSGVVVDSETGETLIGANVLISGTSIGAQSDLDGQFEIPGLPPGEYDVEVSYIGYLTTRVASVRIESGAGARLGIELAPAAIGLDEVVVEAEAARNLEALLLRDRQKAAAVSDAISAEAISRSGSTTASDAMKKVTGASVVGGKYVYVRGLGDRYMNTQLNGATLPSADPDRNAVAFDLFPASLLDNIVTTKTFTPDRPGNFTGGAVNIGTKSFPERLEISLSSSAGYNQAASTRHFLGHASGDFRWFGLGGSSSGIPTAWADGSRTTPNHIQARREAQGAKELDQLSRAFDAEMTPSASNGAMSHSYSFSVGNQVPLLGKPLGFLASVSYSRDHTSYRDGNESIYLLTGNVATVNELNVQQSLIDSRSTAEALWGGLGTLSYKPHPNHSVSTSFLYNRFATSEARYLVGTVPRNFAANRQLESRVLSYTERKISSLQLSGNHVIPALGRLRVDWIGSRVTTEQDEPDLRYFASDFTVSQRNGTADTSYSIATSNYPAPTRYFRDLHESGRDAGLNLALPFGSGSIKAGVAANLRNRTFRERGFRYVQRTPYNGSPADFFAQVGVLDSTISPTGTITYEIGNYLIDATSPRNNYDGSQEVYAGYGMVEVRPLRRLRTVAGVRYEQTHLDVASVDEAVPEAFLREGDWLPSLNAVLEFGRMNFRAAYGRTLARPTFRELAPFTTFSFINAPTLTGNPNLKRTLIHNLDVRWEWFVRPGEIVAFSGFYKRFIDPIERTILNNNFETRFENVDNADVFGVEVEARKRLDDVSLWLRGLEVGGNLTLAHSRVDIPGDELAEILALDPGADPQRSLQGQSPYVINADLTYTTLGTTVSTLYNVFGRRLSEISLGGTPNIYELPFHSLDVIASQRVMPWLLLRGTVRNLLDSQVRRAYPFKGEDYVASAYSVGRSISISFTMDY